MGKIQRRERVNVKICYNIEPCESGSDGGVNISSVCHIQYCEALWPPDCILINSTKIFGLKIIRGTNVTAEIIITFL